MISYEHAQKSKIIKKKKKKKIYLNGDRGFGDLGILALLSSLQIWSSIPRKSLTITKILSGLASSLLTSPWKYSVISLTCNRTLFSSSCNSFRLFSAWPRNDFMEPTKFLLLWSLPKSLFTRFCSFLFPSERFETELARTSMSTVAVFFTLQSSVLSPETRSRPILLYPSSLSSTVLFFVFRLIFPMMLSEALIPSVRIISWTTKWSKVVFPSVPFTSESLRRASSLNALAPPLIVPTFILFPVFSTASSSFRKSLLDLSSLQASWQTRRMRLFLGKEKNGVHQGGRSCVQVVS